MEKQTTKKWLILIDGLPSLSHCRFDTLEEAQNEINRINAAIVADNKRIEENPATGRGSCFLNVKDKRTFTIQEITISE